MKSLSLENIYLSKESIIRAVSLLNQYKKNKRVNLRKTFEDNLGKYLGAKHSFACNSGTNGLHVALLSLGIKKGEEVITNPLNYNIGTISSILKCGAKPVLAKITKDGVMDVKDVEKKVNSKTRGIIAVHLNGFAENLIGLEGIKKKHGLFIVEDACQALGAEIKIKKKWKKLGTVGDVGVFSFGLVKLVTTIEGGLVVTNDSRLVSRIETFLSQGGFKGKKFIPGFNSRLDCLRAAIGLGNFGSIDYRISERKKKWSKYYKSLSNYSWLRIMRPNGYQVTNYMSFIISVENERTRAKLIRLLQVVGYDLNQDVKRFKLNKFVDCEAPLEMKKDIRGFKANKISLPVHQEISESDIGMIIKCFKSIDSKVAKKK